ncbi:hypothetical protein [Microcystis sp. M113S1]|nr:hypothetical protein [Microcystis sp. M113S1]
MSRTKTPRKWNRDLEIEELKIKIAHDRSSKVRNHKRGQQTGGVQ